MVKSTKRHDRDQQVSGSSLFSEELRKAALEQERQELQAKLSTAKTAKERRTIKLETRIEAKRAETLSVKSSSKALSSSAALRNALEAIVTAPAADSTTSGSAGGIRGRTANVLQFARLAADPSFKGKGAFGLLQAHLRKTTSSASNK